MQVRIIERQKSRIIERHRKKVKFTADPKREVVLLNERKKFSYITFEAKKGSSGTIVDCTKEHSTISGTPLRPFRHASAKTAPA